MRMITCTLSFILFSTTMALAKMGFEKVEGEAYSQSVFKIIAPAGSYQIVSDFSQANIQSLKETFRKENSPWRNYQLDYCLQYGFTKCLIFKQMATGSAVVYKAANSLLTNFHLFRPFFVAQLKEVDSFRQDYENNIVKINIPFVLENSKGKQIYNGLSSSPAVVKLINTNKKIVPFDMESSLHAEISDIVALEFSQSVGVPLVISKTDDWLVNSGLCNVGYPSQTRDRRSWQAKDSNGESMYKSCGQRMTVAEKMSRTENQFPVSVLPLLDQSFVFSDADIVEGNSGGAILNSRNELVGIVTSFDKNKSDGSRISVGLNLINLDETLKTWGRFSK